MTYSTTIYATNVYAASSLQELGAFSAVSVEAFAAGFKSISDSAITSVQIDVLSDGFPIYFGSSSDSVTTDPFSASTFVVSGQAITSVDVVPFGDWNTSRSGFAVSDVNIVNLSNGFKKMLDSATTSIVVDVFGHLVSGVARSAIAQILVETSAKAQFSPIVDFDNVYWNWPLLAQYDHPHVYYTRPGDHWKEGASSVNQARATFRFHGKRIRVQLPQNRERGIVRIYLDGDFVAQQDLFSVINEDFVYDIMDLSPGLHELSVQPTARSNPAAKDSIIQIGEFSYKHEVVAEDQGEEVIDRSWSANTVNS